ncbi:MAG: sialate O-acetylesterase [Bythopirellula sp.]
MRRFAQAICSVAALVLLAAACGTLKADVFTNVAEASADGYELVYTLPIEDRAGYSFAGSVPYSVDNTATTTGPFDRIAYYLELDDGSGLEYAYASMDAFTSDINQVGLPTDGTGAFFQRNVASLNVFSNASGVTTGTELTTGNIEFWPRNYGTDNSAGVPGADSGSFDHGDTPSSGGNYGSFQIHNHGVGESIISYNQWGGFDPLADGDLGIGNSPFGNQDWTFRGNADDYPVKNLQILVRPSALSLDSGLERSVFQRDSQNRASVPVSGLVAAGITSIEARATPRDGQGTSTQWQVIDASLGDGSYAGELTLDGGWYDLQVRSLNGNSVVEQRSVERVGVGEVLVIAGQSNSANYGNPALAAVEDRVSAFDLNRWQHADDPQPIATSSGGSPWPALGDALVAELNVPIGFVTVGWGGTSVAQWLPGAGGPDPQGPLYDRLRDALQALGPDGARAVLWHQGESDNSANTSTSDYQQRLENIIAQSRSDAGFAIPWGIAQASFISLSNPTDLNIIDAQAAVANNDPLNFVGAATDDLGGPAWRWDGIHFNEPGLREHAERWFDQLLLNFDFVQFVGDFDADDDVDADDLAAWDAGYGTTSTANLAQGDADGDQDVDGSDFVAWQQHQGRSFNAVRTAQIVPESSSILITFAALLCESFVARRRVLRVCGRQPMTDAAK